MMTLLFTLIIDRPPLGLSPKSKDLGIFRPPLCNFAAGLTDARHIHVHVYMVAAASARSPTLGTETPATASATSRAIEVV